MIKKRFEELKLGDILIVTEGKKQEYAFLVNIDAEKRVISLEFSQHTDDYSINDVNYEFDCIGEELEMVHKRKFSSLIAMAKQSTKNLYLVELDQTKKGKDLYVSVVHKDGQAYLHLEERGKKDAKKRK